MVDGADFVDLHALRFQQPDDGARSGRVDSLRVEIAATLLAGNYAEHDAGQQDDSGHEDDPTAPVPALGQQGIGCGHRGTAGTAGANPDSAGPGRDTESVLVETAHECIVGRRRRVPAVADTVECDGSSRQVVGETREHDTGFRGRLVSGSAGSWIEQAALLEPHDDGAVALDNCGRPVLPARGGLGGSSVLGSSAALGREERIGACPTPRQRAHAQDDHGDDQPEYHHEQPQGHRSTQDACRPADQILNAFDDPLDDLLHERGFGVVTRVGQFAASQFACLVPAQLDRDVGGQPGPRGHARVHDVRTHTGPAAGGAGGAKSVRPGMLTPAARASSMSRPSRRIRRST